MDFPPTTSPNPDKFDGFIQQNHDFLESLFDESFCLCDFFDAELNKALWQHLDDSYRGANSYDFEVTNALLFPPKTFIDGSITSSSANSSHLHPQSPHSFKAATPQATEKSSSNPKSNPFTEAEWQEIYNVVLQIYLEKSLKEILETLPERTTYKPSRKQLKTKIKLWHENGLLPRKNIDKEDMDYMISVAHLRKEAHGLQTVFTYHGFPMSQEKLRKHKERFGVTHLQLNPQALLPHITWMTPSVLHATPRTTVEGIPGPSKSTNSPQAADKHSLQSHPKALRQAPISTSVSAATAPITQDPNADTMGYLGVLGPKSPRDDLDTVPDRSAPAITEMPSDELKDYTMDDRDDVASVVVVHLDEDLSAIPEDDSYKITPTKTSSSSTNGGYISLGRHETGCLKSAESEDKRIATEQWSREVKAIYECHDG